MPALRSVGSRTIMESPTVPVAGSAVVPARRTRRAERLLVLMDDTLMRAVVLASLESASSLDVVAVTGSEAEALELLADGRLDIVLLDGEADRLAPLVHRVEALAGASTARVVCFVSSGDARRISALLLAGAESCVATSVAPGDLATVVREASRGTIFHAPPAPLGQLATVPPPALVSGLTHREFEVLSLAAEGLANKQIAQRLWVTPKTIKFHLSTSSASSTCRTAPRRRAGRSASGSCSPAAAAQPTDPRRSRTGTRRSARGPAIPAEPAGVIGDLAVEARKNLSAVAVDVHDDDR